MKKEVKINTMANTMKESFYLTCFNDIRNGLRPSQIAIKYKMSRQRVNPYIRVLKQKGLIKNIGYGVWKVIGKDVKKTPIDAQGKMSKNVRGHGFIFRLQIPYLENWESRGDHLRRKKIPFKRIGLFKSNHSLVLKGFKVWLCSKTIVVYFPKYKNYFSNQAFNSRSDATSDFLAIIKTLERLFSTSLRIEGRYIFKLCKHHYALIKNELAKEYLDKGLSVRFVQKGKEWALIDNSYNLQELETVSIKADQDSVGLQNVLNSHRDNKFKVTADFILDGFDKLIKDRVYYAKHIKDHVGAINELAKGVKRLTKKIEEKFK